MCDIIPFAVCVPIPGYTSVIIPKFFMHDVFLKFGLFSFVVFDDGTLFNEVFPSMYDPFHLRYGIVAKRNHNTVSVERSHDVLNKDQTIFFSNDRDTVGVFTKAGIPAVYVCNSDPIDGTDIICSIPEMF